jgi:hypothetical protein
MPFKDYLVALGPSWLQRAVWKRYLQQAGAAMDTAVLSTKVGVKERFPDFAASDALTTIGGERQLPRAPGETDPNFAARLKDAWQTWYWGGTAFGLLRAFSIPGYSTAKIEIVNGLQYQLNRTGQLEIFGLPSGSWLIDADQSYWSKFQVVFCHPNLPASWVPNLPLADSDEVNLLRTLIRKWSPGFATCSGIVVITAGRSFGYPPGVSAQIPQGLTIGTLAQRGYSFQGNSVTVWTV